MPDPAEHRHDAPPPALTADAMRTADRTTIDDVGLPGFTLMETAGRGAAAAIERHFGSADGLSVTCFCGKGNNGGDGFVVARVLHAAGARVRVVALGEADAMSEDAARNWHLLERLAARDTTGRLTLARYENLRQVAAFPSPDLSVDALLGTGLTSALRAPIAPLVKWLNAQPQPTVSLDVPTGLHSDRGVALGAAVEAELTITMAALKSGLLINDGSRYAGQIEVVEIGIPSFVLDDAAAPGTPGCARVTTDAAIRSWLPRRANDANKYTAGLALVVGGSEGMTGAPTMSALATARAGAGFVTCACQEHIQSVLAQKMTEITTLALPAVDGGGIDPDGALDRLTDRLEKARALLVGPGLGRHPQTQAFVRRLLQHTDLPVVIDADGLNALAEDPDFITEHANGNWILTPHAGEFSRLADPDVDLEDRVRVVQEYARRWHCVIILKGMPSVVGAPDGTAYINTTGNPALATAGTGDVLAGLCTGMLAQGLSPERAAVCALHVGGAAADRYARERGATTMMALDLLDHLPLVMRERFS